MAVQDKGLTPMMKQFFSMKAKHPEALMLFRCGDFYETYGEDAVIAAGILGITLTKRNNSAENSVEMAGFPHHALDTYLPKLIRAGKRVAICDQLEDPKKKREQIKGKKGLTEMDKMVKRGITELVTPGVAMADTVLNYKENNFCTLERPLVASAFWIFRPVNSLQVRAHTTMLRSCWATFRRKKCCITATISKILNAILVQNIVCLKWMNGCFPSRMHVKNY